MFGRHYFGGRYYGPRYFGDGGSGTPPSGASAAEIWNYVLPNGLTAGQNVVDIRAMLLQLTGGSLVLPVNVKQVNDIPIQGAGVSGNHWRPV
jgi:hypothetical protein